MVKKRKLIHKKSQNVFKKKFFYLLFYLKILIVALNQFFAHNIFKHDVKEFLQVKAHLHYAKIGCFNECKKYFAFVKHASLAHFRHTEQQVHLS